MWGTTIGKGTWFGVFFKIFGNVCSIFVRFNRLWRLFCANAGKTILFNSGHIYIPSVSFPLSS